MNPLSWAKKEFARLRLQKQRRLLPPSSSAATAKCLSLPPQVQEVIIAADLRCGECERRVAGILSKIDDVESMVFHVSEKKVTLTRKTAVK